MRIIYCSELKRDLKPQNPEVNGFKKLDPRLDDKFLEKIWGQDNYPNGWLERVDKIKYSDVKIPPLKQHGLDSKNWETIAHYDPNQEEKKAEIIVFKAAESLGNSAQVREIIVILNATINHEYGHGNDWEEEDMDFVSRIKFLEDVAKEFFNEDRMISDYVETIDNPNQQEENYLKIREYWAEICMAYFSYPELLKDAHPASFALVEKYVKQEDPKFDIWKARDRKIDAIVNIKE